MTCETCGAPTGWVRGKDLERAHESKRTAMDEVKILREALERITAYPVTPDDEIGYTGCRRIARQALDNYRDR